jgi:hypothetical protein
MSGPRWDRLARIGARSGAPPPFASRARLRAPPAGGCPAGSFYLVRCRLMAVDQSSSGQVFGSPCAVLRRLPSGMVLHVLARGFDRARRSAPGRSPARRACLLMRCPRRRRPLTSRPAVRTRPFGWPPRPGHPLRPAVGLANPRDHQRTAGDPLAVPPPQLDLGGPPSTPTKSGKGAERDRSDGREIREFSGRNPGAACATSGNAFPIGSG